MNAIQQQAAEVMEAARKAGIATEDPVGPLLAKIVGLAEAVSNATAHGQTDAIVRQITDAVQKLGAAASVHEDELERAMFRAGLTVARQLAVRVERRTAMAIGAAGVLLAVLAGYAGYEIGTAGTGPVAACWQQGGKQVCTPAVWIGEQQR